MVPDLAGWGRPFPGRFWNLRCPRAVGAVDGGVLHRTEEWDVGSGETCSFPTKWMSADGSLC